MGENFPGTMPFLGGEGDQLTPLDQCGISIRASAKRMILFNMSPVKSLMPPPGRTLSKMGA